jgi:predicted nucleotidyltransferase
MTNRSPRIFAPRTHSVPELVIDVTRLVHQSAQDLQTGYILAGATARDLVLSRIFGLAPGRATLDLDFAFTVADWQQFESLKAKLEATDRFESSSSIPPRMFYDPGRGASRLIIDLIPFGGVAREDGTLAWPPDAETVMNVTGFSDAFASAIFVRLAPISSSQLSHPRDWPS